MRERGAFGFMGVILIVTIVFFAITSDEKEQYVDARSIENSETVDGPTITINGQTFTPSVVDRGDGGQMVIVVDQGDLLVGENTVEIQWGKAPPETITAEIASNLQQH